LPSLPPRRWAWAEVDLGVVAANAARLAELAAPARLWAVVKANAYGHGDCEVARAAVAGGAHGLCVATADEALRVRQAVRDVPLLVLSEPPREALPELVAAGVALTAYHPEWIVAIGEAARANDVIADVHLKLDTGMHRIGATPQDAARLVHLVNATPATRLAGVMTHLATADEPGGDLTRLQMDAFVAAVHTVRDQLHDDTHVHVANSAALFDRESWIDVLGGFALPMIVRSGIALYGVSPATHVDLGTHGVRAPLTLKARVTNVQRLCAGEGVSYGHRTVLTRDSVVATVPLGYADGIRRDAGLLGMHVLVGGRRRRILGVVTMDQLMVDCGDDPVAIGDDVVLVGDQQGESVGIEEWADVLGTIGYEVLCGISPRVPRVYTEAG
jgi:alanine racemase